MDYKKLETDFDCACNDVIDDLSKQYKSDYESGGPGKLEAFFELIRDAFERVESAFVDSHQLTSDKEALKRIRAIAKSYAKKCVTYYGKV